MITLDERYVESAAPNADAVKNGRALLLKGKFKSLHVDPDDLVDLVDQEVDERRAVVRELDDQLVDGSAGAALEDVDAGEVATHRTDSAGQGTEGTGTVRHPDPEDVGGLHDQHRTEGP